MGIFLGGTNIVRQPGVAGEEPSRAPVVANPGQQWPKFQAG